MREGGRANSDCGKLVKVILEFVDAMKLVSAEDLGSIVHLGTVS